MRRRAGRKPNRNKSVSFKPNRDFLQKAMADYLAKGGTITKLELDDESYKNFVATPESPYAVDDFLAGK